MRAPASPESGAPAPGLPRSRYEVLVLGGGPAGLAAALASAEAGARTCLVEREERLGGILKQCVHDGFGLRRFGEALTGPEYARRFTARIPGSGLDLALEASVHAARRGPGGRGFSLDCLSRERGLFGLDAEALVLATGCRERSDRQALIQGDRPAGILSAGLAQRLVNVEGLLPGRRALILGSGDIGLIMARRLLLEGVEVEGVYEIKAEPSGLARNLAQCLEDFGIPLRLSTTVTEVQGRRRVEAATVASVDQRGAPIPGTERRLPCDTLVLSVGLIPENETALALGLSLDPATRGPRVDQSGATELPGLFACGNSVHVSDLVDHVSETGEAAGRAAAAYARGGAAPGRRLPLRAGPGLLYAVPQLLDPALPGPAALFFRSNATLREGGLLRLRAGGQVLLERRYPVLRPPEAERLEFDAALLPAGAESLSLELERAGSREGGRP